MADSLPPAERLLNLVIALVNTPGRMTKEQIRSSVAGYDRDGSTEAFERMFERDKETLRELGIPLTTVHGPAHGDDAGYRVDLDAYALPPMELDAAQLAVLGLAADFWQDQSLRADATRALTKLRVVGDTSSESSAGTDAVVGLAPRLHAAGPALAPLLDAAQARQVVSFTYRAASTGEVLRRTVEPWRIIASRGGWYLVGHDQGRGAPRVFRLSRIVDDVVPVGQTGAFEVPDDVDPMAMLAASQQGSTRIAWLSVAADRAGALRSRALDAAAPDLTDHERPATAPLPGHDLVAVPFERSADLADELLGYTDAVVVLGPEDLRADVVTRLREAVAVADRLAGAEGRDG